MRFLANENFPDAVGALAASGHDIVWVRNEAPGSHDEDVLNWAVRENRVLLTFDQDFGELAWAHRFAGKLRHRIASNSDARSQVGATLAARLNERSDWAGHFSVIQPGRVRMRPLPMSR
jgi:predicted nuclease of predicted toxin-antitoxin system